MTSPFAWTKWLGAAAGAVLLAGCGSDTEPASSAPVGPEDEAAARADLGLACSDPLDTFYDAVTPPAAWTEDMRGDVVRCAYDRFVTKDEMSAHFVQYGYPDPGIRTGAHKIRLLYWTERGPGEPVLTSAAFYLPATRVGSPSPLLVVGHGSVGLADKCAPSREDPDGFDQDWGAQLYTFAGDGWVTIQPDFPGLGTPGAASWMRSVDEGHAMLDATRAARKAAKPGLLSTKNALIGHSNGGHAALSAQSYAKDYGSDGTIETTVVYAPFWISNGAWGALLTTFGASLLTDVFMFMTMDYFYGHLDAELGGDHATDAFLPEKAGDARDYIEGSCWRKTVDVPGPSSIGIKKASQIFTPEYIADVGACGLSGTCDSPLAAEWKARWTSDRPPADPTIPIVLWQGAKDDFLKPGYQKCGIDRLEAQTEKLTVCIDAEGSHTTPIPDTAAWVRQYLNSMLLGGEGPAPCVGVESLGPDLECNAPIENSLDPGEP